MLCARRVSGVLLVEMKMESVCGIFCGIACGEIMTVQVQAGCLLPSYYQSIPAPDQMKSCSVTSRPGVDQHLSRIY
jgi:hypothetical protein